MGRTTYAITLTFIWLVLLMLRPHATMTPALLIPAILIVGAWLAAAGNRTGYVAFYATSIVLTFFLGLLSICALAMTGVYFLGGHVEEIAQMLVTAVVLLTAAVVQFIGIGVLRPTSARAEPVIQQLGGRR